MMRWNERGLWFLMLALVVAARMVYASVTDTAPYIITNTAGSPLHVLGTDGLIQNSGAKLMNATAKWTLQSATGATLYQISSNGQPTVNVTDNAGSFSVAQSSATQEVTLTYNTAEANTGY